MKVLHVINSLNMGGAERLLTFLLPRLNSVEGVSAELLLLADSGSSLTSALEVGGVKCYSLNASNIYNPILIKKLMSFFKSGYDIVHAHLFPTQYWATIAKTLQGKSAPKLIFTEHNTSNKRIASSLLSLVDRLFYLPLDRLVCITEEIEQIYVAYQPQLSGKTCVIHNGVPIEEIASATPALRSNFEGHFSEADRLILQVSGFRAQKDQETLIRSLALLPPHFKALFAGNGERLELCKRIAEEVGVSDRVLFLGNRSDVYALQKMVDYIVLSTHYEGLSLACIEGMASGTPFLASDVKGVHSLVAGAGVLFEESNSHDLARKILELEENNAYHENVVRKCQDRANNYSVQKMADAHIKLYQELIS